MVRGHNNHRPGPSTAQKEARRQPRFSALPKAKPTFIIDDRPSQRVKPGKKAPDWITVKKGQYEKIPGTRIQKSKGGFPVRVVVADGKVFPAEKSAAAKKHLRILFQQEKEKLETERIINGGVATRAMPEPPRWLEKSEKRASRSHLTLSKKARKEEERRRRRQLHEESTKRDGRKIVSDQFHLGQVVETAPNRAWVRLLHPESIALLAKLRAEVPTSGEPTPSGNEERKEATPAVNGGEVASADVPPENDQERSQVPTCAAGESQSVDWGLPASMEAPPASGSVSGGDSHSQHPASGQGSCSQVAGSADMLPIRLVDVAEPGLKLLPGVAVRFKLYKDKNGVGGCEAASRDPETGTPRRKKRKKGAAIAGKPCSPPAPGVELSVKTDTGTGLSAVAAAETLPGPVT